MVGTSSNGKKKRKGKKTAKRKPVNMQSNYNSKFIARGRAADTGTAVVDVGAGAGTDRYATISQDMFPTNEPDDVAGAAGRAESNDCCDDPTDTGGFATGDFHMHSVCSDGKHKPAEVIQKAASNGVKYMSLTDHDTMAGVPEAMCAAQELNVLVIPGVEISAEVKGGENLHILGYFYPGSNNMALERQLEKIREGRHKRGKEMLRKLASMNVKLEWKRVLEIAGEAAPGRPHVAQALVEAGHVSNFREAFSRYLHNNGPAYVEGEHFPPEEAIKLIDSAGGVSVLAHPWCCKNPITLVPELAALGIHGIEVYHDSNKIDMYGALAKESNLLKLGGSDFHGIDPVAEHAPGDIPFPRRHVEAFLEHAKRVWETPLRSELEKIAARCQSNADNASIQEELLIWREQLDFALEVAASLPNVDVTVRDQSTPDTDNHYRVLLIQPRAPVIN
ncbi:TPA: hypothetical protein N0F65_000096 [Lagenidium giganteum]|uniref:Polymerase/histidinol phosphatase N-terminal domain-containing protein n=1 Tax=Lagenidium giganteum TaxID=4803 RepID=A0AAV2YPB7_9STRA|nr:TPA: hypothetical protein N0F65_000096 [Lagenidium giganteum]